MPVLPIHAGFRPRIRMYVIAPEVVRGSPGNPLRNDLLEKFNDCVRESLNSDQESELIGMIDSIEDIVDISDLVRRASVN